MNSDESLSRQSTLEAERLALFVSGVTDYAIYMLSPEGIIKSWNAGAERFKGYQADEIIGKHLSTFYTAEDIAAGVPEKAIATARTQGKFEDEGWRVRKNGTRFWASVVLDPIRDESGELIGFTKITRDITERRRAADALRESEQQFRLLVQSVKDYAIYMLSPDGVITNWNSGAERIKGYSGSEVIGTHFSRFYSEQDRQAGLPAKALAIAAETGGFEKEGWRIRKDGSRFWAHVIIDPIKNEAGELIGFAKVTRDVTERREAAAALEKAREALFHAQKQESLGRLTGGVAHDFNNLLSVLVNGITLLRMSARSQQEVKTLDSMERAASRGATLTQQLLSFSRQQPLKAERHDINRVVSSFESVLRRALKSSIRFSLRLAPSLPPVMVDATQFEAALLNLVVNAGDAVGDVGTVVLQTAVAQLPEGNDQKVPAGQYVYISLHDTGAGIPPDIQDRVTEPFFTTKPIGKGTGLGLSQVYGLIQQSSGGMSIESGAESGTTISLYLPALESDEISVSSSSSLAVATDKALIVDDQPDVLDMACALFRMLGYEVIAANSGMEALDMLDRHRDVSLLFTDVVMPGMNGVELAREAKNIIPTIKIILATGYAENVLGTLLKEPREFALIMKPYRLSDIIQYIRA
jgi:PAS domain S-box-containing protein